MERLNLLLLGFEYPPYPLAGTGRFAVNLIKNLKNHRVTFITPKHGDTQEFEQAGNLTIIRLPVAGTRKVAKVNVSLIDKKTLFSIKANKYIKGKINLKEYDLLHSLTLRDGAFLDHKHITKQIPSILGVNDYYIIGASWNPLKFPATTDVSLRYIHHNIMKLFYFKALRNCTHIIANCDYVKNVIASGGVPDNKISVVLRGIDNNAFEVEPAGNKYTSHNILFVGPNFERKGGYQLIRAAPKIISRVPGASFTMIGSPNKILKGKIKQFLENERISAHFFFADSWPPDSMPELYAKANVFVMPSQREALGQVYMEAMSAQTPVVGGDVGDARKIITPDAGTLVNPKDVDQIVDAVVDILSEPEKARRMGRAGRARSRSLFSVERMVKEIEKVYYNLLANSQESAHA
jgi:glycosyltransferase involved in cell wall biosynthesis